MELVNKVNSIGVDINFCIEHSHAEHMLPYVAGFGPRKSTGLLKVINIIIYYYYCCCLFFLLLFVAAVATGEHSAPEQVSDCDPVLHWSSSVY